MRRTRTRLGRAVPHVPCAARTVWRTSGRLRGLEPIALRSLTPKLTVLELLAGLEASPGFVTVKRHLRVRQTFGVLCGEGQPANTFAN